MKGILIPTHGEPSIVEHDGTFSTIYPILECRTIERVVRTQWVEPGQEMLVDEEGTFVDPPNVNPNASLLKGDFVYGHAVIVGLSGAHYVDINDVDGSLARYLQVIAAIRRRKPAAVMALDAMADAYRTVWSESEPSS